MRYRIPAALSWRIIEGKAYVVDRSSDFLHELDPVGTAIWQFLSRAPAPLTDIVNDLCDRYDVDPARAERDATHFLNELHALRMIEHAD